MVDSRLKGARGETLIKEELRKRTKLNWQRTPGSGALAVTHMLKGDLYIPETNMNYCVEVKHYKDDHLTSKILTNKDPQLLEWWSQAVRQGLQVGKKPILFFKFDRSKIFVAFEEPHPDDGKFMVIHYNEYEFYVMLIDDFFKLGVEWTK